MKGVITYIHKGEQHSEEFFLEPSDGTKPFYSFIDGVLDKTKSNTLCKITLEPLDKDTAVFEFVGVDLNRLYLFGNEGGAGTPCGKLNKVEEIRFAFASEADTDISIDNIRFAPDTSDGRMQVDPDISTADTLIEKISAIFIKAIGMLISIFR